MPTKRMLPVIVAAWCLAGLATASFAQQAPPQPSGQSQTMATPDKPMTIDCPPTAAAMPPGQAVGSPQGTGSGSGLAAMPSVGQPQRVEGAIRAIDSTRTNRIVTVGDIKLEVEPSTVILVGCKPGSITDLKRGAQIKAAYEVKKPNRTVATVIEAES
jgi:hypothetical protein